ncbi:MAG: class II fumarate hydratase [Candidatus Eiseniibacteriota bacterium]|jgi:fumarate hydratase class II
MSESQRHRALRTERDSMGEVQVPADALYGAQTQRAVDNFPVSGLTMPRPFIRALGLIKIAAARANAALGQLDGERAAAIEQAARRVASGECDGDFPIDVYQTGSGTSSNMNANEVIANLAGRDGVRVHPNDDVNRGQSSNDTVPSAIQAAAALELSEALLPALGHLEATLRARSGELRDVVKTGRTHLMDAMPITLGQELAGWADQVAGGAARLLEAHERLLELPQGGTAVGTGVNAHPQFGARVAAELETLTGLPFRAASNPFTGIGGQERLVAASAALKVLATTLMKIANDLRWMNSGPLAGLGEIELPALQPGSSIMPGKVNPVVPEAVAMVAAQIIGHDTAITIAAQSANFQLNVMLPLIAHDLLESIAIAASSSRLLADRAVRGFTVREEVLERALGANPILVTALNARIGYDRAAAIAKRAYAEQRPVLDVAREMCDLPPEELERLLDPARLTRGGIPDA